jgi:hypothetical protein
MQVQFIKAFFFPWKGAKHDGGNEFSLPLGGYKLIDRITVLPNTTIAKKFYAKQLFARGECDNKHVFNPYIPHHIASGSVDSACVESWFGENCWIRAENLLDELSLPR